MKLSFLQRGGRVWIALGHAGLFFVACASNEKSRVSVGTATAFAPVGNVLERRCGTLDCHGDPARSLRIYGRIGLRAAGQDRPGGRATTATEVEQTWESLVLIDPFTLEAARAGTGAPELWLPLAKGAGRLTHKGGAALPAGSAAEDCLLAFALGSEDTASCLQDELGPIPKPGEVF